MLKPQRHTRILLISTLLIGALGCSEAESDDPNAAGGSGATGSGAAGGTAVGGTAGNAGMGGLSAGGTAGTAAAGSGGTGSGGADPCGNAMLDPGESCDTAIASGPGACPSALTCDDADPCTVNAVRNGDTCGAACDYSQSLPANLTTSDSCCPSGANSATDIDCAVDCSSSVAPPGLASDSMTYQSLNDGIDFGETTHTDVLINIHNSRFAVVSGFGTTRTNFRRRLDFVTPPTNRNEAGHSTISISECPGDFSSTATCVKTVAPFSSMRFSTNPADDPGFYCILDPNKTYYMNVVHSPDPYAVAPSCFSPADTTCALFYTETNQ